MTAHSHDRATSTWRSDIDGLRAFAVVAVVLHHFFPGLVRGGFVGVDIFFVISGFLIGGILLDAFAQDRFNLLDFYARRARRILPALLLVLGMCLLFGWLVLLPEDYGNLAKHVAGGAGFVSNLLLYSETGYFDEAAETKPLLHLWSLGIEEQFYLFLPLFLYAVSRSARQGQRRLVVAIALAALLSFVWNLATYRTAAGFDFYMPMTRFWELLAGVLLAMWQRRAVASEASQFATGKAHSSWRDRRQWIAGLGFVLLLLSLTAKERHFPGIQALAPVLGAVLLIATGMPSGPPTLFNRLLAWRPLVWIGLISYPLYLWHWPLLVFPRIILGEMPAPGSRWLLLALSVILATLTYRLVERPMRFGTRPGLKAVVLVVGLAVTGLVSWGIHVHVVRSGGTTDQLRQFNRSLVEQNDDGCRRRFAGMYNSLAANHDFAGKSGREPYCRYHDAGGTHTIVVWGDSHALSAFDAIAAYNASGGVNTWLVGRSAFRHIRAQTLPWVSDVIAQSIQQEPSVHSVFIILTAEDMDSERVQRVLQPIIGRMSQLGKPVYVLADNPILPFDPRILDSEQPLRAMLHSLQGTSATPSLLKADVAAAQKDYLAALNQLRGATLIPSLDAFCPTEKCLLFDEAGGGLYRNEDHLSRHSGGRFLVNQVLKPYLDKQ